MPIFTRQVHQQYRSASSKLLPCFVSGTSQSASPILSTALSTATFAVLGLVCSFNHAEVLANTNPVSDSAITSIANVCSVVYSINADDFRKYITGAQVITSMQSGIKEKASGGYP
ncbi:hypothetical protein BT63DRAFT_450660 [Microthyrium microscopicum]|uniref:Uncharacterized protein n=1 Tax=Microthyrium microscopicum TaxID=703497 RepID=A0A6A6UK69_9PEZI|nr:hypothetical protein BT63DRAFT_450660 [Microthyrium microscopicum]